jgi:hypothetical protein
MYLQKKKKKQIILHIILEYSHFMYLITHDSHESFFFFEWEPSLAIYI